MKKLQKILISVLLCLLAVMPVHAEGQTWILDHAGVMSDQTIASLASRIDSIVSNNYVGIYVRLEKDMGDETDIEQYAEDLYQQEDLGVGKARDGILLVMSFDQRDYDLAAYGPRANAIFTDAAKKQIEDAMLAYFKEDQWDDGITAMVDQTETILNEYTASGGKQYHDYYASHTSSGYSGFELFLLFGVPPLLALLIVWAIASRNKTKGIAVSADTYATGHLNLRRREDIFTHVTRTVTHISHDNDSHGGTSVDSSGFSHSSGKF
ncbi:MAG: TPM domain-containing protein [Lactimicrobium sp.]|jgi:uncharacterized membrane protein YgcG|uniref:TPM domain-containing protein n=1 Tax=Lactimicrobium sp. TaxID=2563780 RepID=UPI002F355A2B